MSGQRLKQQLRVGEGIDGRVYEVLPGGDLIISFQGDLLRVANGTRVAFKAGDAVSLAVVAVSPPRFKLLDGLRSSMNGRLNLLG